MAIDGLRGQDKAMVSPAVEHDDWQIIDIVSHLQHMRGLSTVTVAHVDCELRRGMSRHTLDRMRRLVREGYMHETTAKGRGSVFKLTPKGWDAATHGRASGPNR